MKIIERIVDTQEQEAVTLEYVKLTQTFKDIRDYCRNKGRTITVYAEDKQICQLPLSDVLYIEAVGEKVFAYTTGQVYEVKARLYQLEEMLEPHRLVRASKSLLINMFYIISVRTALNGRLYAKMENGEDVLVTRNYAKKISALIMEGLDEEF